MEQHTPVEPGLSETAPVSLQATWQRLATRYDWQLIHNEAAFLEELEQTYAVIRRSSTPSQRQRAAILHCYSKHMYQGLRNRSERAASEIWHLIYRISRRRGLTRMQAEEVTQQIMLRVLEQQERVRDPGCFLAWIMRLCRSRTGRRPAHTPEPAHDDPTGNSQPAEALERIVDPCNIHDMVEQHILIQRLAYELLRALDNPLQRAIILRWLSHGERPAELARVLGQPEYVIRNEKSRAVKRLRERPHVLARIRALVA